MDQIILISIFALIISLIWTTLTIVPALRNKSNSVQQYLETYNKQLTVENKSLFEERDMLKNNLEIETKKLQEQITELKAKITEKDRKIAEQEVRIRNLESQIDLLIERIGPVKKEKRASQTKQTILFVSSSPVNASQLNVIDESKDIEDVIIRSGYVFHAIHASTYSNLIQAIITYKPAILHFSGHGINGDIVLQDTQKRAKIVSLEALARVLKPYPVKGVLLNACFSQTNQKSLLQVSDWVIGMKVAVADPAAIAFSDGFYRTLASGANVQDAFDVGIGSMGMESKDSMSIPVLDQRSH